MVNMANYFNTFKQNQTTGKTDFRLNSSVTEPVSTSPTSQPIKKSGGSSGGSGGGTTTTTETIGTPIYENVLDTEKYQAYLDAKKLEFEKEQAEKVKQKEMEVKAKQETERKRSLVKEKVMSAVSTAKDVIGGINAGLAKRRSESYKARQENIVEVANTELSKEFEERKTKYESEAESAKKDYMVRKQTGTKYTTYTTTTVASASDFSVSQVGKDDNIPKVYTPEVQAGLRSGELKIVDGRIVQSKPVSFISSNMSVKEYEKYVEDFNKPTSKTGSIDLVLAPSIKEFKVQDYQMDVKKSINVVPETRSVSNYNMPTIGIKKESQDISEPEFSIRLSEAYKKIPTNVQIVSTNFKQSSKAFNEKWFGSDNGFKSVLEITKGDVASAVTLTPLFMQKEVLEGTYNTLTDIGAGLFSAGSSSFYQNPFWQKQAVGQLREQGFLNPRQIVSEESKTKLPEQKISDFYLSKQIVESGSYFVPVLGEVSMIGQASRARTVEEIAVPLAVGAGFRIASPFVSSAGSSLVTKANTFLETKLDKFITPKLPVPAGTFATRKFGDLISESTVAKGILVGGAGAEIVGMNFVPLDYKKEYLRQVGLMNVFAPIGYKGAEQAMVTAKYIGIKALSPLQGYATLKVSDVMDETTFAKFSETGGGTPVSRVPEIEQISLLQGVGENQRVSKVFDLLEIDPVKYNVGGAYRSVRGNLPDTVSPKLTYYEGLEQDFYAPVVHPIALSGVGWKQRWMTTQPSLYDNLGFGRASPSIEFTVAPRGTAISFKEGLDFTEKSYLDLKNIYGYNVSGVLSKTPDVDTFVGKIPLPSDKPLSVLELEKIRMGGRPYKTRDIVKLIGEPAFRESVIAKDSVVDDFEGFFSSQSRAVRATSESEIMLASNRERIGLPEKVLFEGKFLGKDVKLNAPRKFFRKLGFADVYVDVGLEYVPMNIEMTTKGLSTSLVPVAKGFSQTKLLTDNTKLLTENDTKSFQPESPIVRDNYLQKTISEESGGLTEEMREVFGRKDVFVRSKLPVVVSTKKQKDSKKNELMVSAFSLKQKPNDFVSYRNDFSIADSYKLPVSDYSRSSTKVSERIVRSYRDTDRGYNRGVLRTPDRIPVRIPDRDLIRTPDREIYRYKQDYEEYYGRGKYKLPDYDYPRIPPRIPRIDVPPRTPPLRPAETRLPYFSTKGLNYMNRNNISIRKTKPIFQLKADLFRKFASAERDIPVNPETIKLRGKLWGRLGSARAFIPTKQLLEKNYIKRIGFNSGKEWISI